MEFGRIIKSATTMADGSVRYVSRGFAIVQYASAEEATAATGRTPLQTLKVMARSSGLPHSLALTPSRRRHATPPALRHD